MITFPRFGQTYNMSVDDLKDMLNRLANPIHPVGRTYSECGTKSETI